MGLLLIPLLFQDPSRESFFSIMTPFLEKAGLKKGDIIFTGTPAGVGPVKIGDRLEAYIEDKKMLDFEVK